MSTTREKIILATCALLEKQGYPATGLNEILRESGTPKGSLYHYFPDGKEQIVSEAVLYSGKILVERLRSELEKSADPYQAIFEYIMRLADKVEEKQFRAGNPLTIVSIEAAGTSERINQACREVYRNLLAALQEKLENSTKTEKEVIDLARLVLVSMEGGILLSRVFRTAEPLRMLADHLRIVLQNGFPPER